MRTLLNTAHRLDVQASRAARYFTGALRGDRIGAEAVTAVVRTHGNADTSNAKPLEYAFDRAPLRTKHEAVPPPQEIRDHGDRQLVDEPDRGFKVEHLESKRSHEPSPVDALFPNSADYKAKEFARQYLDGSTPIEIVEDAWSEAERGKPGFVVYFPVAASKYDEAVAAGRMQAGLFGTEGTVAHTKPGADALDRLVEPNQKRAAIEAFYHKQPQEVDRNYIDDLKGITYHDYRDAREELETVSQVYEFRDGARSTRLVNFSPIHLSEEQIRQTANVIRSISERSGGELSEKLHTIVVLPQGYKGMQQPATMSDGTTEMIPINGYQSSNLVALSDRLLRPQDQRELNPRSNEIYEKFRLPGETMHDPGSPRVRVSDTEWELTLAHELTHIVLPENTPGVTSLPGPAPTLYGRYNTAEHLAELGAAEYAGGEHARAIPEDQRQTLQDLRRQRMEKDPILGPHFIVGRQLDPTSGALPLRLKYPDQPLPVEVTYRLVPDA